MKPKDKPLKIDIPEDAALRAFLRTPPPDMFSAKEREYLAKLNPPERKKPAKKKPAKKRARR